MNFFLSNTRLVILVSLTFLVMGIRGLLQLQRESIPPVDFARASILTVYPGSSAKEVEELISSKIEDEIRGLDNIKDINTVSRPGLSSIDIRIDIDKTNTEEVINKLSQKLQNVQGLPPEVLNPPRLMHYDSATENPIIIFYITGPNKGRTKEQLRFQLEHRLEQVPGVLQVNKPGYQKKELSIFLSKEKMEKHYISSIDVILALEQYTSDIPAGYLESPNTQHLVRALGKTRTAENIKNVVIRSNFSGQKVLIKDVAQVIDGAEKQTFREYFVTQPNEFNPSTSLEVRKSKITDTISLIAALNTSLKEFKKNLNKDYKIVTGFNEGKNVKRRLTNVINNALGGMILIFIVFFLFLPSKTGFMVGFSLPLSILGTFAILPFIGVSFNIVTMLAFVICIGMLIDNSVVIGEYYSRLVTEDKKTPAFASQQAVRQFKKPITATVLTTIVAFLPMLVTTGVMGQFTKWIPIVVTLALLMSLFESFCLLPNRLKWLTQKKPSHYQQFLLKKFQKLEDFFEKAIKKIISKKYLGLSGIALLIVLTALVFKFGNRIDLFSTTNPEFYTATIELKPNSSLNLVDKESKRISKKMYEVMGGEDVVKWMSVTASTNNGQEIGRILLRVKPKVLRDLDYKDILNQLRQINKGDLKRLNFNIMEGGPPVGKALQVAFQSNNRQEINRFIDKVLPKIKKIPGLINLKIKPETNRGTEYQIFAKQKTLARLGLNFKSVGLALRTALEGHIITELTENNESFYIRVKQTDMSSLKQLENIKIKEQFGRLIPLKQVAKIKQVPAGPNLWSYNFSPAILLEADINDKKTTSLKVNTLAQNIIEEEFKNKPSSTLSFKMIGEQETTNESLQSLMSAAILAFFAIFVILIVLFKSFILSFLILSCIPLGLVGVIWAFFLHQRDLDFFALIGVVGLAGVVVNSAIILISFILKIKKEEPQSSLSNIVVRASKLRFRPIVITNLTTLGGFLPTAYGIAGFEPLLMSMTLALFWGLLSATLLTLIWIPCAMLVIEDVKRIFYKKFSFSS